MESLMIADDNYDVVFGIETNIDWNQYEISLLPYALNGRDALAKIISNKPDILIIDIRMPELSGLDVLKHITGHGYKTKTIICSGYDEFEYAQEALKYSVTEYLLKPVPWQDVLASVLKLQKQIRLERLQNQKYLQMQKQVEKNMPYLRERYLSKLVCEDGIHSFDQESFQFFGLHVTGGPSTILVVQMDNYLGFEQTHSRLEIESTFMSLSTIVSRTFINHFVCDVFIYMDQIIVCLELPGDRPYNDLTAVCKNIQEIILNEFQITVSIGIGTECNSIEDWYPSYRHALAKLEQIFYMGPNSICIDTPAAGAVQENYIYPQKLDQLLVTAIKLSDKTQCGLLLDQFFDSFSGAKKKVVFSFCTGLIHTLYVACLEYGWDSQELSVSNNEFLYLIENYSSIQDLKNHISKIVYHLCNISLKGKLPSKIINAAVSYINHNYQNSLHLLL